ncbi:family 78 glycoside hydrolase catalytic domain [bacterium]|nr:family 78 glycoside hydrolase catalytic domain [bacterium]
MNWKAKWIWDTSGEHPRNYWLAFRKTFDKPEDVDSAVLNITADSRYVVYINGKRIGFGPVRSWPFEYSYDTYYVKDYLIPGKNVIAVLVTHIGVSTFQYIEGRGGLIAQLDLYKDNEIIESIITDKSWKNREHTSFQRASVRISCQQGWAEIFNANNFSHNWLDIDFDDSNWNDSIEIGNYGVEPWKALVPRDIPYLTEELIYPKRVVSLREVTPVKTHISLDIRPNFFPEDYSANPKAFFGYIATVISSPKDMKGKIVFPFGRWVSVYGRFKLNGRVYEIGEGNSVEVELNQGDNFFLMDISGRYHEFFVHMGFDFEDEVSFKAPLFEGYEFVTIGPFDKEDILLIGKPVDHTVRETTEYRNIWNIQNIEELSQYREFIKPILQEHTCRENVYTLSTVKKVLREYDIPSDYQNLVIPNETYTTIKGVDGDIEFIVDFGRELSGFVEFDIDSPKDVILDLYFFESMHDGIIEDTNGLNNTLRYITKEGRQLYRSFVRRGFRYVMVTVRNLKRPLKFYSIRTYLSTYPVAELGSFYSSDYLLNRIWEISQHTERLCMEDTYVDCPAYEQTFWVGDSRNEALINYYIFGAYELSKRCLRLVPKSLYRSVLPESQVPSGWQNILTAWTLFWMSACKEYYLFTGDMDFLDEIYPSLIKTAKNFERFINEKGLLEITAWNMLDWAPMDTPNSGVVTHQNALLVKALRDVAYISEVLGRNEDRDYLLRFADSLKEAINRYLWDEGNKAYIDSIHNDGSYSKVISQQTNIIVYLCDCAEGERKELLERYLINPPEHFVKIGSPFMSFFYFETLTKINRIDKILEDIRRDWGLMLDYGATTCWETFMGFIKDRLTRSHCHAWSSAPGYFLPAYVLGVRPLEPGFKKVLIQPNLCGLKWAKGSVPTPYGVIEISCKEEDDGIDVKLKLPEGLSAEIVPPSGKKMIINGKEL